jgi:hypothetical protein
MLAWVLGLGVLFLSIYTSRVSGSNGTIGINVLFGTIFGLTAQQATLAAWVGAGAVALLLVMARPLLFASLDLDVAAARGVPVRALGLAFLVVLGVTIGEAVQAVGALLIFSLLVGPRCHRPSAGHTPLRGTGPLGRAGPGVHLGRADHRLLYALSGQFSDQCTRILHLPGCHPGSAWTNSMGTPSEAGPLDDESRARMSGKLCL